MSSNNDDTILPPRRPVNSGGLDGDTVLPSQNATGIHEPGDVIDNRYTVIREIGRGGMGVVYEVEDAITGDHYAVKRLLPTFASRPEIVQQFRTEGAASIRFTNQSRYFVSTQTVGLDDGHPYIVMQLVRYPTLRNRLDASGGRLRTEKALPVLMEIAEGLAELHSLGYIHRDLKPENVFIHQQDADIHVMLVDFGLTKDGSDATATALRGAGTERYASPEQKKGLPTTATSDIYSFGVVAFEVLTGELPGVGDQITDYADDVPPELASIIMQCLSTRPERRPKDGGALIAAMAGATPTALPEPEVAVAKPAPKPPPTKLSTTLRFPDLQVGAKVVIDGSPLVIGGDYDCELDEGTTKSVAIVVTWEGVDLFRDSVVLRAGDSKAIPTRKAYRIDCDVPDWCEVKNANGQRVVFPVTGVVSVPSVAAVFSLIHQRKEFDRLTLTPTAGNQIAEIRYGIGTIQLADVSSECVARINGERVNRQFSSPILIGSTLEVSLVVVDATMVEVYAKKLVMSPNESKLVKVPLPGSSPVDGLLSVETTINVDPQQATKIGASQQLLTRRLVIGCGITGVVGVGGVFVLRARSPLEKYVNSMCRIPSGMFEMGSTDSSYDYERPVHLVTLSDFRMGATPVTVAVWKEYCSATGTKLPKAPSWGLLDEHPVVNVSWNDIMGTDGTGGFCAWASDRTGFRLTLPTEAQFEYVSRGGQNDLDYPWGNTFDDSKVWSSKSSKRSGTAPVIRSSNIFRNGYGLTDMSGNVWQWCSDLYGPYTSSSQTNPTGPSATSDNVRSVRGASWSSDYPSSFRCALRIRDFPDIRYYNLSFRLSAGPV